MNFLKKVILLLLITISFSCQTTKKHTIIVKDTTITDNHSNKVDTKLK
jgi:hypothetical protein